MDLRRKRYSRLAWLTCALLGAGGPSRAAPGPGSAIDLRYTLGLRFERLWLDEGLDFSCDCPPDDGKPVGPPSRLQAQTLEGVTLKSACPGYCSDARLDEAHDGFMLGAILGLRADGAHLGLGLRLVATLGSVTPTARSATDPVGLLHITLELPLEAHLRLTDSELFLQLVPRVGLLDHLNSNADDRQNEFADTFTAGLLLVAGIRFGGPTAGQVSAVGGAVVHPRLRGWMAEGTWSAPIRFDSGEEVP